MCIWKLPAVMLDCKVCCVPPVLDMQSLDTGRVIICNNLKNATLEASLPTLDILRHRVSARSSWPVVGVLWLGEMASLIYICLSVAACSIVEADPYMSYTMLGL